MNSTETSILRVSSSATTSSSSPAVRSPQATITPLRRIFANAGGNTMGPDGSDFHHTQLTCSTHTGEGLPTCHPSNAFVIETASHLDSASPHAPNSNFQSPLTSPRDSSQADKSVAPKVVDTTQNITSTTGQRDSEGRDDVSPASLSSSLSASLNEKPRVEESDSKGEQLTEDGEVGECRSLSREGLVHESSVGARADAQAEAEAALRRFIIPAAHVEGDRFPTSTSERSAQTSYHTPFQIDNRSTNRNDTTNTNRSVVHKSGSNSGGVAHPASSCTAPTQSVASSSLCVSSRFPQAPTGTSTAHEAAILAVNDVAVLQSLLLRTVARQQALEQVVQSLIEGRRGLLVHSLKLRDERDNLRIENEQMAEELRAMKTACERYAAAECKVQGTASVPSPSAEPGARVVSGETSETNRCEVNAEGGATIVASSRTARTSSSRGLPKCEDSGPLSASVTRGNDSVGVDGVHIDPCANTPHSQPPARSQLRSPRHIRVLNTTSQCQTIEPLLATASGAAVGGRNISKVREDTGVGYSKEPAAVVADENESSAEDPLTATIPTAAPRSLSTPPEVPLTDSVPKSNPLVHQKGGLSKRDEHETRDKKKNGTSAIVADSSLGVSEKGKLANKSQNEGTVGPLPKGLSKAHSPRLTSGGVKQKMVAPISSLANVESSIIASHPKPRVVAVAGNKPIGSGGGDAADDDVYGDARGASTHSCVPSSSASTATGSANVGARPRITPFTKPKKSLCATAPIGIGHSVNAPDPPVRKAVSPSRRVPLNTNKKPTVAEGQAAVEDASMLKSGGEVGNLKDVRGSDVVDNIDGPEEAHDGFREQQQQQQCAPSPNRGDLHCPRLLESQRASEEDKFDPNGDVEDSKEANYLRRQSVSLSPSRRGPTSRAPQRISEGAGDGLTASEGTVGHSNSAALAPITNKSQHAQLSHSQRRASPLGAMRRVMASVATGGSNAPGAATNQHPPRRGVGASGFMPGRSASPLPVATGSTHPTSVPQTVASSTRVAATGSSGVSSSLKSSTSHPTTTNTGVNATAPHSSHQSGNRGTVVMNTAAFPSSQARTPVVAALSREKMALVTSSSVGAATTGRTNVSTPNLTSRARKRSPDRGAITNRTATQMSSGHTSGVVGSTPPIPSKLGAITPNASGGKAPKNTPATLPSGE